MQIYSLIVILPFETLKVIKSQLKHTEAPNWLMPASFAFYLVVNIISWHFPFFWDTLLTSTICTEFLQNGWNGGIPPNEIDAGHPPLFYGYLYLWWSFIGQSLTTSHLAMLPFLWVMVYQFIKICERFHLSAKQITFATVLFCLETTIIAQSTMVSYDILILAFYLFGLRYILDNKTTQLAIAGIVLCMISLRGVVAFGALFLTEWILFSNRRNLSTLLYKYAPAILIFAAWNVFHYTQSGWALFSTAEQWSGHRGISSINGMIRNVAVIIRNLLEPGRIALFGFLGLAFLLNYKKVDSTKLKQILTIFLIPLFAFSLFFIPFNNPIGHRYLMVVFALSIPLCIFLLEPFKLKSAIIILIGFCLISGHFWYSFYPSYISKGWDSSLAHIPYFKVRQEVWDYLEAHKIPINSVGAEFPLDVSMQHSKLTSDIKEPTSLKLFSPSGYILVSNLNNDIGLKQIADIELFCEKRKRFENKGVYIDIYECIDETKKKTIQLESH